jgi:TRAP-type transport system periplasmic protein
MAERSDILNLSATLRPSLEKNGLSFATPETEGFRKALTAAGFYGEWKTAFGAEAWAALERYTGALA